MKAFIYEGPRNDIFRPEGQGIGVYYNNDIYRGVYTNGRRNGYGEYVHINEDIYMGEWKFGKREGEGKMFYFFDKARYVAPVIDTSDVPKPFTVESGQPLTITVKVTGKPTPIVKWQIGKKRIKESSKFELKNKDDKYTLTVNKSNNDLNEGIWVVAANDAGDDCCQIEVKVNSKAHSMSDVRQKDVEDDFNVQNKKTSQGGNNKIKKTVSSTSLQDTSEINGTVKSDNDVALDKKKEIILVDEIEDEPYKRRSKRSSLTKLNKKFSQDEMKGDISTKVESNKTKSTDKNTGKKSDSKPPISKSPRKAEAIDRSDVMETDFDSIDIDDTETKTDTIEIVKINEQNDKFTNSDVKIVIVNNDEDDDEDENDEDDEDENDDDDDDENDLKNNNLNGNEVETEFNDEKLWFLNNKNIIELCREALMNYNFEEKNVVDDFSENKNIRKETEITDDIKPKIPEIGRKIFSVNEPNKIHIANTQIKRDNKPETPNTSKQFDKSKINEKSISDKMLTIKNEFSEDRSKIKPDIENKSYENSQKKPENAPTTTQKSLKPALKSPKENHFDKDIDNSKSYSRYRPPSRSSLKLSLTDNIPIPMKPPTHSILGKPPPPPGVVENKPLTLTAYVTHKKSSMVHNTPRRQKRLDKARSRSADPLGRDEEASQEENEFVNSRDASTDSINWERYSCTLPGKGSSSNILGNSGLVPTRSEEYLIIRKSDGKVKSLNNSRDNFFHSFHSLDRLNSSEAGSTSSKIGHRTLNTQYQIVTVTTTEETFVVPKEEDKIDGKERAKTIEDPKSNKGVIKTIQTESELEQRLLQKLKPSVSEKGVGPINFNLKDTGVGPEQIFSTKSDKVSQSDIRISTDKSQQIKPSSTVTGQQTDFVKVQIPTKQSDESTQTNIKDQNKDIVTIAYHEIIPVVSFSPVPPEKEVPKEPSMFVSQVMNFDFCEMNSFYLNETTTAQPSPKIQKSDSKIPKASQPSKNETSELRKTFRDKFQELKTDNRPYTNINVTEDPRDIIGSSPIPPISPHHHQVHDDITPSNRLDSFIFTPGNHTYAKQNRDNIPGQRYVLSYSDGTTPPRDLNRANSKDEQEKPSKIPRSLKSLKSKDTPEKKRDRSCERVVEISEKRRASLTPDDKLDSQNPLKQPHGAHASEVETSFSGGSSGIPSPERSESRSHTPMIYHGPPAIKPNKSNRFEPRWY